MSLEVHDRRRAQSATGRLAAFNDAGVLSAADVHVATRLGVLSGERDEQVLLAVALAVRAVRHGSTALDLATVADQPLDVEPPEAPLPWPEPAGWAARVAASPLVAEQVIRTDLGLVYLDRYWREEGQVRDDVLARLAQEPPDVALAAVRAEVDRVFPAGAPDTYAEQRAAAVAAAGQWTTVLTGGPGTGKTTTVAGLLAVLATRHRAESGRRLRVALCAPTGKASARLQESVERELQRLDPADREALGDLRSSTLHRLLGWRPESSIRFRHDRHHRLPHDVVVLDETSMVSLTMMARLLEALRPTTRLFLVGDPDQLASVEAGAVLADLVDGLRDRPDSPVVGLTTAHRYAGGIARLAAALRAGDADAVLDVLGSGDDVERVDPADERAMAAFRAELTDAAHRVTRAAEAGDAEQATAALDRHRLLCAHREGPYGVGGWNRTVQRLLAERTGVTHYDAWYAGRPVLVTANDQGLGLYNGDVGVTVREPGGRLRVAIRGGAGLTSYATTRLSEVQTVYAMTVHKSQGSQAAEVSVVLPPEESPLLTHELFYTAVTRAQQRVRVVGTEAAVRAAVERTVQRATGLRRRLRDGLPQEGTGV